MEIKLDMDRKWILAISLVIQILRKSRSYLYFYLMSFTPNIHCYGSFDQEFMCIQFV